MTRVKKGVNANKTRRNVLKAVKGHRFGRSKKEKLAIESLKHAGRNAFRDRKKKKSNSRKLFTTRINAATRQEGLSYSKFIDTLKKKDIKLDRKVLSTIAKDKPESFKRLVENIK